MIGHFEKRQLDRPEEFGVEYIDSISQQVINELSFLIDRGSEVKIDNVADSRELLSRCPPMKHFHYLLVLCDVFINCGIVDQLTHQNLLKDFVKVVHVDALRVLLELLKVDLDHFIDFFGGFHANACYIYVGRASSISGLFVKGVVSVSYMSRQGNTTFLLMSIISC